MEVCVEHFNFLRYTLSFDVSEERSDAYDYLTKLWTSMLSPSLGGLLGFAAPTPPGVTRSPDEEFLNRLQIIYSQATELDHKVGSEIAQYKLTGLSGAQAASLQAARAGIADSLTTLNNAYTDLQKMLLEPSHAAQFASAIGGTSKIYTVVVDLYNGTVKRTDLFLTMSEKTVGVEVRKVGKRSAGTKIALMLTAVGEGGAKTPMVDVHYFVDTTIPLVVHGGLTMSTLRDVTFEKVKRATNFSEEDLFQQTGASDTSKMLSAFLAWQFWSSGGTGEGASEKVGVLFSLGTDVRAPGKKIFLGPSLALFNRVILTGGATLGKEASGEQQTLEPNVFRILRERPTTAFFFALSTKVH